MNSTEKLNQRLELMDINGQYFNNQKPTKWIHLFLSLPLSRCEKEQTQAKNASVDWDCIAGDVHHTVYVSVVILGVE